MSKRCVACWVCPEHGVYCMRGCEPEGGFTPHDDLVKDPCDRGPCRIIYGRADAG